MGTDGLPLREGAGEVGEREAVLLQALLRHVHVVVAVLLVKVDERDLSSDSPLIFLAKSEKKALYSPRPSYWAPRAGMALALRRAVGQVRDAAVERDDVLHRRDHVLEAERAASERGSAKCLCLRLSGTRRHVPARGELPEIMVQLDGDLMPADLGEVVLAQVLEDQVVEIRLGLPGHDELLAAELLVDVLLGFLDGLDLVLAQRLEDGRVFLLGVAGQDLDADHFLVEHPLDGLMRDLLAGLEQDLAGGLVDDVLARDAMEQALPSWKGRPRSLSYG